MNETKPIYLGEAQLIRWGHNGTSGKTVTIELPADLPRHPFDGLPIGKESGQRMQVVFVAMDDHEQPLSVDQAIANAARLKGKKRNGPDNAGRSVAVTTGTSGPVPHADKAEGQDKPRTPFDKLPKSQQAGIKCGDDDFDAWLRRLDGDVASEDTTTLLYYHLGITSRKDLDNDAAAAERWDRMLTSFEMRSHAR